MTSNLLMRTDVMKEFLLADEASMFKKLNLMSSRLENFAIQAVMVRQWIEIVH